MLSMESDGLPVSHRALEGTRIPGRAGFRLSHEYVTRVRGNAKPFPRRRDSARPGPRYGKCCWLAARLAPSARGGAARRPRRDCHAGPTPSAAHPKSIFPVEVLMIARRDHELEYELEGEFETELEGELEGEIEGEVE